MWLRACVWPSDLPRLSRLEQATEAFTAARADRPLLEPCSLPAAPARLSLVPERMFVLCMQTIVRDYLTSPEGERYDDGIRRFLLERPPYSALMVELEVDLGSLEVAPRSATLVFRFASVGGRLNELLMRARIRIRGSCSKIPTLSLRLLMRSMPSIRDRNGRRSACTMDACVVFRTISVAGFPNLFPDLPRNYGWLRIRARGRKRERRSALQQHCCCCIRMPVSGTCRSPFAGPDFVITPVRSRCQVVAWIIRMSPSSRLRYAKRTRRLECLRRR